MPTISLPQLKICKNPSCGHVATSYDGYCCQHSPIRRLRQYRESPSVPIGCRNPIGVELELVNPVSLNNLTNVARYVCYDGSLPSNGGEIKMVGDLSRIGNTAADVAQRARLAGAKPTAACGFHVHLSHNANSVNRSTLANRLGKFALKWENYLFDLMPQSRRGNRYCRSLRDASLTNHHAWLSLSERFPTYEIRIHSSTANPWKVKAWIEVCGHIRNIINNGLRMSTDLEFSNYFALFGEKLSDHVPANSLAQKYLLARETTPSLSSFGFVPRSTATPQPAAARPAAARPAAARPAAARPVAAQPAAAQPAAANIPIPQSVIDEMETFMGELVTLVTNDWQSPTPAPATDSTTPN